MRLTGSALIVAAMLVAPVLAQDFRLEDINGQWYARNTLQNGSVVEVQVVINGAEWSSNSMLHVTDAFGLPVTYRSGQGGTLELFPPATLRFAVFWQYPDDINGRGVMLPPGSTFAVDRYTGNQLVLVDLACIQNAPKQQCLLTYQRQL